MWALVDKVQKLVTWLLIIGLDLTSTGKNGELSRSPQLHTRVNDCFVQNSLHP